MPVLNGVGAPMIADEGSAARQADEFGWVRRIAEGDGQAETEFVRRYERGVRALVRRYCRPGDPAVEDLTQDVLAGVLERLRAGAIRDPAALPAYIQATIMRATSAEYRGRRNEVAISAADGLRDGADPADDAVASQRHGLLRALMQTLPVARDREVLARFYLDEQDRDDVCRDLGIDAAHFRRVLFRARERFRELLLAAGLHEI